VAESAAILLGYLLGSVLPAYILGRAIKRIDIRQYGTGNAGTMNARKVLGFWAAVPTAVYDTLKGVLVVYLSLKLFKVSPPFAYASGAAAVIGHVFPFYLRFRGGQGVATSVGLMLRNLFLLYRDPGVLKLVYFDFTALLLLVLVLLWVSRKGEVIGAFVLPLLGYFIVARRGINSLSLFTIVIVLYILSIDLFNLFRERELALRREVRESMKMWRFALRPLAILFLIFYDLLGKPFAVTLLGGVTLVFLVFDLVRLAHARVNLFVFRNLVSFFKAKEERRFSSMTLFLISASITLLLFERPISFLVVTYLIFGDMFAKFFGLRYGRRGFFQKTLEGSAAYFASCVVAGTLLMEHISVTPAEVLLGSAVSSLAEAVPMGMDDNLSVALIGSIALWAFRAGSAIF
jgi:glycerol-3-phosphate acyltransferase PlsY